MSEIKVNSVVNSTGDNDSGLDLSTNDQVIIKTANTTALTVDSSQNVTLAGNLTVTGTASGVGKLLQVISASTTAEVSSTSSTLVDTGLTAEITPISTSSKILITFSVFQFSSAAVGYGDLKLVRGSTGLETYGFNNYAGSSTIMSTSTYQHLDSPATTSATTYKIQFNNKNAGTVFCQYDDANGEGVSTMTLMEIAG